MYVELDKRRSGQIDVSRDLCSDSMPRAHDNDGHPSLSASAKAVHMLIGSLACGAHFITLIEEEAWSLPQPRFSRSNSALCLCLLSSQD